MREMPLEDAPDLSAATHESSDDGQVIYITEHGQRLAAIVPADVATAVVAALEAYEDALDLKLAQESLAEWEADGYRTYTLEEIDAELGES